MTLRRTTTFTILACAAFFGLWASTAWASPFYGPDGSVLYQVNCYCTPDDKAVEDSLGTCQIRDWVMAGHTDTEGQCESRCKNDANDDWQLPYKWSEFDSCALQISQCADVGDGKCDWYDTNGSAKSHYFCKPNDPSLCRQPCYCRYPDNYAVATCRGKTVEFAPPTGQMGTPSQCSVLCAALGGFVNVTADEAHQCSFWAQDEECNKLWSSYKGDKEDKIDYNRFSYARCYDATPHCYCRYPSDFYIAECQTLPMYVGLAQNPDAEKWCREYCASRKHGGKEPFPFYKLSYGGLKEQVCFYDDKNGCVVPYQGIDHPACKDAEFLRELTDKRTDEKLKEIAAYEQNYAQRTGSTVSLPLPLGAKSPQAAVGKIIKQVFGVVGGLALGMFVYAGFLWMTAAGNPDKVKKAKSTIVWASIGLLSLFAAYAIVNFIIQSLA